MACSTCTKKPVALGLTPSFGFGDRLGIATPGHLDSLKAEGGPIRGIMAQQSIREMTRTKRTATLVVVAAANAIESEGYDEPWGADADHLKTEQDVDYTADAGFIFYTIDPSAHVDQAADNYKPTIIDEKFAALDGQIAWVDQYLGKTIEVDSSLSLTFEPLAVKRAAIKYGKAIIHALHISDYIKQAAAKRHQDYEIEISVDETDQPTTLQEHYIIADQLCQHGVKLVSLAPRYIGDFEKGIDFKGDLVALEKSLNDHAAIARKLGPYKLSLHSGSDKLSIYGLFARATQGMFHVKTAGTSYLEALRVVAKHDESLFREIIDFSRGRFATDKATYHISATVAGVAAPADISSGHELEGLYLEHWDEVATGVGFTKPGRQILHCTFGSVLTDANLGKRVHELLVSEPRTHREILSLHFGKHLAALRSGM